MIAAIVLQRSCFHFCSFDDIVIKFTKLDEIDLLNRQLKLVETPTAKYGAYKNFKLFLIASGSSNSFKIFSNICSSMLHSSAFMWQGFGFEITMIYKKPIFFYFCSPMYLFNSLVIISMTCSLILLSWNKTNERSFQNVWVSNLLHEIEFLSTDSSCDGICCSNVLFTVTNSKGCFLWLTLHNILN